jgi:predicted Rossmann fold nucleotide-binding protein DprA/Smf involved in DNA uptake
LSVKPCHVWFAEAPDVAIDDIDSAQRPPPRPSSRTHMFRQQLLDTGRGRIVSLLQRGPLTVDDIASKLELSASGVRAQITAMERDGVVRRVGRRPGTTGRRESLS